MLPNISIKNTCHSFCGTHGSDFARRRTSNKLLPSNYIESANFFPHQILNPSSRRSSVHFWQRDFGLPLYHNRDNESSPGKRNYIDRFMVTYVTSSNFVPFSSSTSSFRLPRCTFYWKNSGLSLTSFLIPRTRATKTSFLSRSMGSCIGNVCRTPRSFLSPIQRKVTRRGLSACVFRFLILGYDPRILIFLILHSAWQWKKKDL